MSFRDAGLLALESTVNLYLAQDPEISASLGKLHGKVIGFELLGTGVTMFFVPDQNANLQVLGSYEGTPDCLIKGSPISFLDSLFQNNNDAVFSGDIEISGSSQIAQEFTSILKRIDIDWEEHLSKFTGDIVAQQVGSFIKNTASWMSRNLNSTQLNVQEYLQEESRLSPGQLEIENFYNDVDLLRDDVERLQARINRLQEKPGDDV